MISFRHIFASVSRLTKREIKQKVDCRIMKRYLKNTWLIRHVPRRHRFVTRISTIHTLRILGKEQIGLKVPMLYHSKIHHNFIIFVYGVNFDEKTEDGEGEKTGNR